MSINATATHRAVLTWRDVSVAIDELIALSECTVDIFDQSLALQGWDSAARFDLLNHAIKARNVQVRILLVDTREVSSAMPRIVDLLRTHGHKVQITGSTARALPASNYIVADRQQLLFRPNSVQSVGTLDFYNPYKSTTYDQSFEVLWQQGGRRMFPEAFGL